MSHENREGGGFPLNHWINSSFSLTLCFFFSQLTFYLGSFGTIVYAALGLGGTGAAAMIVSIHAAGGLLALFLSKMNLPVTRTPRFPLLLLGVAIGSAIGIALLG